MLCSKFTCIYLEISDQKRQNLLIILHSGTSYFDVKKSTICSSGLRAPLAAKFSLTVQQNFTDAKEYFTNLSAQGLTLSTVPSSGTSDIDCRTIISVQLLFRLTSGIIRRIIRQVITGPVRSPLLKKIGSNLQGIYEDLGT